MAKGRLVKASSIWQEKNKSKRVPKSYIDERIDDDIWDTFTPIVSEGDIHTVYITSGIEEPVEYNKLVQFLRMVPEEHEVKVVLNTPGGVVDSAFMLVSALKACKAKTTAVLEGTIASAGTIITMACDEVEVGDYMSLMIHNYSTGTGGKGHEIKAYVDFNNKELNRAFRDIYKGFLSDKEMDSVIEGQDMWLNKKDVLKRWKRKAGK